EYSTDGTGSNPIFARELGYVFNGSTWDRVRNASTSTETASTSKGILIEKGGRWNVINAPSTGVQATITKTACAAGCRHVLDCIGSSAVAGVAPASTFVNVGVRDGTSGTGNFLWAYIAQVTATTGNLVPAFGICGLNIVGSDNTAMTIEFSGGVT